MKRMIQWVLAATLLCGATTFMTACKTTKALEGADVKTVKSSELIRTSQSWDGVELPDYLKGRPELVAVNYVFPAGQKLGWHHLTVMNYGILVLGELTILGQDGKGETVCSGAYEGWGLSLCGRALSIFGRYLDGGGVCEAVLVL